MCLIYSNFTQINKVDIILLELIKKSKYLIIIYSVKYYKPGIYVIINNLFW